MTLVSELVDEVLAQISAKSRPTYRPGILRLAAEYGERDVSTVRLPELERLRNAVQREAGEAIVAIARQRGRRLRAYDPDAHGKGAAENFVRAVRFYFRYAEQTGRLQQNPAQALRAPRRPPAPERPLLEHELAEIWVGALNGSRDPQLDSLLLTFLRRTAARREGCLNLTIDQLDEPNGQVTLTEKHGESRTLPLGRPLLRNIRHLAHTRGAERPGDAAFRYQDGTPLTRRRFNTIFDRVDRNCGWTEPLDVGPHWIRHTTLADIAAVSDVRVAAAYAGHSPGSLGVIGIYTRVTFDDLVDAYEAVFGSRD